MYWSFIRLNPTGGSITQTVPEARAFFLARFPTFAQTGNQGQIQLQLFALYRQVFLEPGSAALNLPGLCLRCFISHQIRSVCGHLAQQFGETYGFRVNDLLGYVLTDDLATEMHPHSLASEILTSFDPSRGANLSSWVHRKTRHDAELNACLLEYGVYLVSDWAILNDTKPKQLETILLDFHQRTRSYIQRSAQLLASYHRIYRQARLSTPGPKGGQRCRPPTQEQLRQIASGADLSHWSPQATLATLEEMAALLRDYRIYVRGGRRHLSSLDDQPHASHRDRIPNPEPEETEEQTTFVNFFRQQLTQSLDQAIAEVTHQTITRLQSKNPQKARDFVTALYLFHSQGMPMGEIAKNLNLKRQCDVSRLLDLRQFRAAVRRHLLGQLRDRCLQKLGLSLAPDRLQQFDVALEERLEEIIQEAENEASRARGGALRSRFAVSLCRYLKNHLPP